MIREGLQTRRWVGANSMCAGIIPALAVSTDSKWLYFAGGLALAALCAGLVAWFLRRKESQSPSEAGFTDYHRLISEACGDVFFDYNPVTDAIAWNGDPAAQLCGYDPGEIHLDFSKPSNIVHNADWEQVRACFRNVSENARTDTEFRLLSKSGEWLWTHMTLVPVKDHEGKLLHAVGTLRSSSEQHETQQALSEGRRMQTVGTMAGGIAHEFNNHLTPVRGYLELALDHLGDHHAMAEGLRTALDRVEYCSELVGQIQAYGRKSLLMPKPIRLERIVPSIVRVAMSTDRKLAAKVAVDQLVPETLPNIWVDQGQFQQAIVHLIRNSLESMPDGGELTVRAEEISVGAGEASRQGAKAGTFVRISIIDTGVGISPEHLEHIFEPFFTTHGRARARGMGLPMVQGMIAQHGGWIEIHSEPQQGTRVMMYFPVKTEEEQREEEAPADADGTMAVLPAAPLGQMLIADDEDFIRDIIRRVFETEGWSVHEAQDKNDVLKRVLVDKTRYDLIVLDVTTPGPPTEETVEKILEAQDQAKILLISGYSRDERIEHLTEMGDIDFMGKPFSPKEILSKVDELMASAP